MPSDAAEPINPRFAGMGLAELDACETVLGKLADELGFDAAGAFALARQGVPMIQALGLPTQTGDALYAQAFAQFNRGQTLNSLALFQALTFLEPNVRDYWLGLGICCRVTGQFEIANVGFMTAASLAPETPAPYFHLCELRCLSKDWVAAAEALARYDILPESAEKSHIEPEMRRLRTLVSMRND